MRKLGAFVIALVVAVWPVAVIAQPHEARGEAKEHDAKKEHASAPKPINWGDFGNKEQPAYLAVFMNFAILIGAYVYWGREPIAKALVDRKKAITADIDNAQQMLREARQRAKKYQAQLETAESDANVGRESILGAANNEQMRIVTEAQEKAARLKRETGFLAEQEGRQLELDLRKELVDTAAGRAEELLRKELTSADQERLAEEYLKEIGGVIQTSLGRRGAEA